MGEPLIGGVFSSPKLVSHHYSLNNGMAQEVATRWASIAFVSARDFVLAVVRLNPKLVVRIECCPWY